MSPFPTRRPDLQQQDAAVAEMNRQAAEQDFIQQQQQEQRRMQQMQEEQARDAARAQKAALANAKRQGVKIAPDATGAETIQRHPDGQPVYEAGFVGEPQITDKGGAVSYRDARGQRYDVPFDAIRSKPDPTGETFYSFDVTGPNGQKQTMRQPAGTKPLFRVDPSTGSRIVDVTDPTTGSVQPRVVGVDPLVANKAAIEKRKNAAQLAQNERSGAAEELRLQLAQKDTLLQPVRQKLREAQEAADKLAKEKSTYEQTADGYYAVTSLGDGVEPMRRKVDSPAEIAKADAWVKNRAMTEKALADAKAAHDPAAAEIQAMKERRAALAIETLKEDNRAQAEIQRMQEAAEKGTDVTQADWQTRVQSLANDERMRKLNTIADLEAAGDPLAPDVAQAAMPEAAASINRMMSDLWSGTVNTGRDLLNAGITGGNITLEKAIANAPGMANRTGKPATTDEARKIAAKSLGITDPASVEVTPNDLGHLELRYGDQEFASYEPDRNRITIMQTAGGLHERAADLIANADKDGVPVYLSNTYPNKAEQPFTAAELRDLLVQGVDAVRSADSQATAEAALSQVGLAPNDIRGMVRSGKLSVQDGRMMLDKFHGVEAVNYSRPAIEQELGRVLATSKTAKADWEAGNKAAVINRVLDGVASKATSGVVVDRGVLEQRRQELLSQHVKEGAASKVGGFFKELIMPMVGIGAAIPRTVLHEVTGGAFTTESQELSNRDWNDYQKRVAGFVDKMQNRDKVLSGVEKLRAWAKTANPNDQPPDELAEELAGIVYNEYHELTDDAAKALNTSRDTFNVNRDPMLRAALQSYLKTANPAAFGQLTGLMMMDAQDRKTQAAMLAYVENPRVASAGDVIGRAKGLAIDLTPDQAGALIGISRVLARTDDPKAQQKLIADAGKIMGLEGQEAAETLSRVTADETDDPDSAWGLLKGGFSAGKQEVVIEAATMAAEAGLAWVTAGAATPEIIAARAARQGIKTGIRAAIRRNAQAAFTKLADSSTAFAKTSALLGTARRTVGTGLANMGEAFAKAGIKTPTFGNPLSRMSRIRNKAVQVGKVAAVAAPIESLEEFAAAVGEPAPSEESIAHQMMMGFAGGMIIAPVFMGVSSIGQAWRNRGAGAQWEARKAGYIDELNRRMESVPGFKPLTVADFDAWQGLQDNPAHTQARAAYQSALATFEQELALHQEAAAGNSSLPLTTELLAARVQLDSAAKELELATSSAFMAMDELRGIPEAERPLYTGAAKAATGARDFTEAEAKALMAQGGNNAVVFQQAEVMPADVAGPPAQRTVGAPAVSNVAPGVYRLPAGVRVDVPPALLDSLVQKAPTMVDLLRQPANQTPAVQAVVAKVDAKKQATTKAGKSAPATPADTQAAAELSAQAPAMKALPKVAKKRSKLLATLKDKGVVVRVVNTAAEAEAILGKKVLKGRKGVATNVNGVPHVVLIGEQSVDAMADTLDHEAIHGLSLAFAAENPELHAAAMLAVDPASPEFDAALNEFMRREYNGYDKLSPRQKFEEALRAIVEGRWKGRTSAKSKGFKKFLKAFLAYVRGLMDGSQNAALKQIVANIETALQNEPNTQARQTMIDALDRFESTVKDGVATDAKPEINGFGVTPTEDQVASMVPDLFDPGLSTGSRSTTPAIEEKKAAVTRRVEELLGFPNGYLTPLRWNVSKVFKTTDGKYIKIGSTNSVEDMQRIQAQLELLRDSPHAVVPELKVLHSAGIFALMQKEAGVEGASLAGELEATDKMLFEQLKEQNPLSAESNNGALRVETDGSLKNMALYVQDGMVRTRAFDFDGIADGTTPAEIDTARQILSDTPLMPGIPLTAFSQAIQNKITAQSQPLITQRTNILPVAVLAAQAPTPGANPAGGVAPEPGKPGSRETTPAAGQREPVTPSIETPIDNAPAPLPQDLDAKLAALTKGGSVSFSKAEKDTVNASWGEASPFNVPDAFKKGKTAKSARDLPMGSRIDDDTPVAKEEVLFIVEAIAEAEMQRRNTLAKRRLVVIGGHVANDGGAGYFWDTDTVAVNPQRLARMVWAEMLNAGKAPTRRLVAEQARGVITHEIVHAAQFEAARLAYSKIKGDKPAFEEWVKGYYEAIWNSLDPEQQQATIAAYGTILANAPEWHRGAEASRMLLETGTMERMSEAIIRHLENVLAVLKRWYDDVVNGKAENAIVADEIERVQAVLDAWNSGGTVKPDAKKKPAKAKAQKPEAAQTSKPADPAPEMSTSGTNLTNSQAIPPATTQTNANKKDQAKGQTQEVLTPASPETAPRESELSNPDMGSAGAVDGDAGDKALADAFSGLYSSPARLTQADLPKERRDAMMKAASVLVDVGVKTPLELAQRLEKLAPNGALRQYSRAFWRLMTGFDSTLEESPDWQGVYAEIDQPAEVQEPVSPEATISPEAKSEQGAAPASYLERVLDAAIKDGMGELTIPVPEKNQNRDDLQKAIEAIQARGLQASTDGKNILVRGFRELAPASAKEQDEANRLAGIRLEERFNREFEQKRPQIEALFDEEGKTWVVKNGKIAKPGGIQERWTPDELKQMVAKFRDAGLAASVTGSSGQSMKSTFALIDTDSQRMFGIVMNERAAQASAAAKRDAQQQEQAKKQGYLAEADQDALQWMNQTFGDDFANEYNKKALSDFLTGKATKFSGMVSQRWTDGVKALGAIADAESGTVDFAAIKKAYNASKSAKADTPATAEAKVEEQVQTIAVGALWADLSRFFAAENSDGMRSAALKDLKAGTASDDAKGYLIDLLANPNYKGTAKSLAPQLIARLKATMAAEEVPEMPTSVTPPQAAAVAKEEAMPEPAKQAAPFDSAAAKGQKKFLLAELSAAVKAATHRSDMTKEQNEVINLLGELPTALNKADTKDAIDELRLNLSAAKADAERLIGYITIEVPGDGTFTILNEKSALAQFQKRADKFPVAQIRDDMPNKPTVQAPTAVPALKKAKTTADVVAAIFPMVSADTTRGTILQKVKGDGTYLWASDGRAAVRVEQENGGGKGEENVIYDEKGNAKPVPTDERNPDMQQVFPDDKAFPSYELDTGRWFSLMSQARAVLKELPGESESQWKSVSIYLNPDGSLGVFASDINRGDYAHNIQPEAKILAAYNPEYIQTILRVARNLGNEQIELRIQDDVTPATLRAGNALFVLMPMRVGASRSPFTTTQAEPAQEAAPAEEAPLSLEDFKVGDRVVWTRAKNEANRGKEAVVTRLIKSRNAVEIDLGGRKFDADPDKLDKAPESPVEGDLTKLKRTLELVQSDIGAHEDSRLMKGVSDEMLQKEATRLEGEIAKVEARIKPATKAQTAPSTWRKTHTVTKGGGKLPTGTPVEFIQDSVEKASGLKTAIVRDAKGRDFQIDPDAITPAESPEMAAEPKSPADLIRQHLDADDAASALAVFDGMTKDEINKTAQAVFGRGFYNNTKAEMLSALKQWLPDSTKSVMTALAKQSAIASAKRALKTAKENQQRHSEGILGMPTTEQAFKSVSDAEGKDPHGIGKEAVAKAWQKEVDDAQAKVDELESAPAAPAMPRDRAEAIVRNLTPKEQAGKLNPKERAALDEARASLEAPLASAPVRDTATAMADPDKAARSLRAKNLRAIRKNPLKQYLMKSHLAGVLDVGGVIEFLKDSLKHIGTVLNPDYKFDPQHVDRFFDAWGMLMGYKNRMLDLAGVWKPTRYKSDLIAHMIDLANANGWTWGIAKDKSRPYDKYNEVVYFDTPLGQASFHLKNRPHLNNPPAELHRQILELVEKVKQAREMPVYQPPTIKSLNNLPMWGRLREKVNAAQMAFWTQKREAERSLGGSLKKIATTLKIAGRSKMKVAELESVVDAAVRALPNVAEAQKAYTAAKTELETQEARKIELAKERSKRHSKKHHRASLERQSREDIITGLKAEITVLANSHPDYVLENEWRLTYDITSSYDPPHWVWRKPYLGEWTGKPGETRHILRQLFNAPKVTDLVKDEAAPVFQGGFQRQESSKASAVGGTWPQKGESSPADVNPESSRASGGMLASSPAPKPNRATQAMRDIIEGLPPPHREVLRDLLVNGMSIEDAATTHGISETAVGNILRRGEAIVRNLAGKEQAGKLNPKERAALDEARASLEAPLASAPVRSSRDAEYLAAVEAGDMAKAQAMVDKAAKAADVTYVAKVPISRLSYGELPGVGEERKLRDGDAQPLIVERTGSGDTLALADGYHRLEGMILNGETEVTVIILNSEDSESVSGLGEQKEFRRIQREHDGESADPVTRDESGQVIPLSQRFNPQSDSILYSAPAPKPNRATQAMRDIIEGLPPPHREVLRDLLVNGMSIEDAATTHGISETAVGNILRRGEAHIRLMLDRAPTKPTVQVQDGIVKATDGRPDLAMSGNAAVAAVDQRRMTPEEVTHAEMQELATRLFDVAPAEAESLVVRWMDSGTTVLSTDGMPDSIKAIVADAQARNAAEMMMTAAAKMLVARKTLEGGNSTQLARLIYLYRNTGTEQARALGMRRDPFDTPEERAAMYLSEALLTPPDAIKNELRRNPANRDRILAAWAKRADEIKAEMLAHGIDLDATFADHAEEQKLVEETIPEPVKPVLARAPKKTRQLVKAIMQGMTPAEAIRAAGLTAKAAFRAYQDFRASLNQTGTEAAQAMRDQLLRSAPAPGADFAANLGLPDLTEAEWLEAVQNNKPLRTAPETEKLKQHREKAKKAGTIDLKNSNSTRKAIRAIEERKSNAFEKISEFWRASILSGPQTHVVNLVSGLTYGAYEASFKKLAAGVQGDIARMFGAKPDAASLADIPAMIAATLPSIKLAFLDGISAWKSETRAFENYALQLRDDNGELFKEQFNPALKGTLGKIMRGISFRLMGAADEFVKSFFTRIEVAAQARQIARNEGKTGLELAKAIQELMEPGSLAWERALGQAKKITFQTEIGSGSASIDAIDGLAQLISRTKKGDFGKPLKGLAHFTFPFVDTPTNIFKAGVTMSPVGGLLALVDMIRAYNRYRKGNAEEAAKIYNAARALDDLTNQIVAWGFILGLSHLVKPGDDEDETPFITGTIPWRSTSPGERELAYRTAPPQSIRIGDRWISYKRLDPFASALAFTVDAIKEFQSGKPIDEVGTKIGLGMMRNMQDKTFLQGVSDVVNAIQDPERFGTKWATNIATGFIPNLIRQPIRTADDVFRETDLPNDLGFWDALGRRMGYGIYPQGAMPAITVWGEPARKDTGTGGPNTDWMLRLLSPADMRAANVDMLDVALLRYNATHQDGDPKALFGVTAPSRELQRTIGGQAIKISLDDAEYEDFITKAGQAARQAIGNTYDGRDLTEADVERIKDILQRAHGVFRDAAFVQAVQKRGGLNALANTSK